MVRNFLKNGTEVADLTGYVIHENEAPEVYGIIRARGEGNEEQEKKEKKRSTEGGHNDSNNRSNRFGMLSR